MKIVAFLDSVTLRAFAHMDRDVTLPSSLRFVNVSVPLAHIDRPVTDQSINTHGSLALLELFSNGERNMRNTDVNILF